MKFGKIANLEKVDFTIPPDHPGTVKMLKSESSKSKNLEVYVGCAKWNKKDLKNLVLSR